MADGPANTWSNPSPAVGRAEPIGYRRNYDLMPEWAEHDRRLQPLFGRHTLPRSRTPVEHVPWWGRHRRNRYGRSGRSIYTAASNHFEALRPDRGSSRHALATGWRDRDRFRGASLVCRRSGSTCPSPDQGQLSERGIPAINQFGLQDTRARSHRPIDLRPATRWGRHFVQHRVLMAKQPRTASPARRVPAPPGDDPTQLTLNEGNVA
jgi:hypothetical protein